MSRSAPSSLLGAWVVPGWFSGERAVADNAVIVIVMLGVVVMPGAVAFLFDGVYLGTADYSWLVRGSALATAMYLPIWLVVLLRPSVGLGVLWTGLALWMSARAVLQFWYFRSGRWLVHS